MVGARDGRRREGAHGDRRKDARDLPRRGGKRSGTVFARITATDNFDPFRDRSSPIAQRITAAMAFMQSASNIQKLYGEAAASGDPRSSEIVELMGLQLRSFSLQFELFGEVVPKLDKDDPGYMTRISFIDDFRRFSAGGVVFCLQMLAERVGYSKDDRRRLVAHMNETVPALFAQWQPVIRAEVVTAFDRAASDPAVRELEPAFAGLHDRVRIAAARPAP